MSQENVETLRRMYETLNGGDDQPLRDLLRPEFVYRSRQELPGGGAYGAHDLLRRLDELREIFLEARFQPEEFICSDSAIIVRVRGIARGRVSGVPIDEHLFHVWTMESGKASALCIYAARAEALEAAGLTE
jgi:ketosteroid isomerase-like protein